MNFPKADTPETTTPITCSAPGSLMVSGEHAVLHNRHALVGAVDRRVYVTLKPRADNLIHIQSALGMRSMPLTQIDISRPFHFIGAALKKYASDFGHGFDLIIKADFPADVGLGSSAAISVATLAVLKTALQGKFPDKGALLQEGVELIRNVQGRGSGADVAASIYGGVLLYKQTPQVVRRYTHLPRITLVYAGYKTPTPQVIEIVEKNRQKSPDGFKAVYDRIELFTLAADKALSEGDWRALGNALNRGQLMMEMLGVCDEPLAEIVATMSGLPQIWGVKISGSGLGDCVLGIGHSADLKSRNKVINAQFSSQGIKLEMPENMN